MKRFFAFAGAVHVGMAAWVVPVLVIGWLVNVASPGTLMLVFAFVGVLAAWRSYRWMLSRLED